MRSRVARLVIAGFVLLFSVSLCFIEAGAQRRRTKRPRRVTHPVVRVPTRQPSIPSTQSSEPQIISTADQQATRDAEQSEFAAQNSDTPRSSRSKRRAQPEDENSARLNDLSNQVNKLTDKLTQMEQSQRVLVDLERLSRAEQRTELLRTQLRDVQDKEGNLLGRSEQIEYDLKPENIERSVSTFGSTRPEDARDARRRALESEKIRVRAQLDSLATSKQRLETAIVNADLEVDKLRKRLEDATDGARKSETADSTTENNDAEESDSTSTTSPRIKSTSPNSTTPQF